MKTIDAWWKEFFEEDDRYGKNDFVLGFIFFVLACCIYFSKISSKLPNPDAIWNGLFYKESYHWEVSLGRYMSYGRKYINIIFFLMLAVIIFEILIKQRITIGRKTVLAALFLLFPLVSMSICIFAPEVSIYDATGVLMLPTMNFVYILAVVLKQSLKGRACGIGLLAGGVSVCAMLLCLELGGQSYMQYNLLKTYNVAGQIERSVDQYTQTGKICIIGNMEDGNYPDCYPRLAESQHWLTAGYKTIWSDFSGCQNCWLRFMEQYFGRTYGMCSLDEYHNIISTPEYLSMGTFPDADGVAVINGIVVVKLSDAGW